MLDFRVVRTLHEKGHDFGQDLLHLIFLIIWKRFLQNLWGMCKGKAVLAMIIDFVRFGICSYNDFTDKRCAYVTFKWCVRYTSENLKVVRTLPNEKKSVSVFNHCCFKWIAYWHPLCLSHINVHVTPLVSFSLVIEYTIYILYEQKSMCV
jgi:hypothetical protein